MQLMAIGRPVSGDKLHATLRSRFYALTTWGYPDSRKEEHNPDGRNCPAHTVGVLNFGNLRLPLTRE